MSDTPEGPDWWKATDGRWYPPELFTGPPELRPSSDRQAARTESDEVSARHTSRPGRPNRTAPLIAVAAVLLLLVAAGAWWVLARDDSDDSGDDSAAVAASTSTGPVRVAGTLRIDASAPVTAIAPRDCDGWSQLLRIQVLGPSGDLLTEFAPPPTESSAGRTATRDEATKDLECELRIAADVPAEPDYTVVVRNVRDGGRPSVSQQIDGAEQGEVGTGDLTLAYTCDAADVCALRPAG